MPKLTFQIQDFSRGNAPKTMCRAVWPRAIKVLQGGIDLRLLSDMADHGLELVVLRETYNEDSQPSEAPERVSNLLKLAAQLNPLRDRGVEVALEFPYNEELQTSPDGLTKLSAVTVDQGPRILLSGYSVVIGIFSEGNPPDLGYWPSFFPALRWARTQWSINRRVYLGLHEYSTPNVGGPFDGSHEGMYREVWPLLPDDCKVPILVTEGGIDGGIDGRKETGWRSYMDASKYATWCGKRAVEYAKDPQVWHVFDFLCGGNDQWKDFDIQDEVDLRPVYTPGPNQPRWFPGLPSGGQMNIGTGFQKLVPFLGQPQESEVYHFAGTANEASLAVFADGSAHWDHTANTVVAVRRSDKQVFVDKGDGVRAV